MRGIRHPFRVRSISVMSLILAKGLIKRKSSLNLFWCPSIAQIPNHDNGGRVIFRCRDNSCGLHLIKRIHIYRRKGLHYQDAKRCHSSHVVLQQPSRFQNQLDQPTSRLHHHTPKLQPLVFPASPRRRCSLCYWHQRVRTEPADSMQLT